MATEHRPAPRPAACRQPTAASSAAAAGRAVFCVLCVLVWPTTALAAQALELPLKQWEFRAKGRFVGRSDRRDLYQIAHPLEAARAGDYGRIAAQVTLPEGMKPPYTLRFYVSDSIYGEGHTKKWSVADVRVGHRFKRALVDGKVVWSQDIAVNTPRTDPHYTLVDITPHVRPGKAFAVGLQLWQEVDSDRQMPDDLIKLGIYAGTTKQYEPLPREKYGTQSYWGDVAIHAGPPPAADKLPCQWQPRLERTNLQFPRVAPALRERAALQAECCNLLAGSWPWPVTQGIPLPMGALKQVENMRLLGPKGDVVCARFAPMSHWPDGSLRWVLADFALPAGSGRDYALEWGRDVAAPAAAPENPVHASDDLHLSNGLIWARWTLDEASTPKDLVVGRGDGQVVVRGLRPYMSFKAKPLQPRWHKGTWLSRSPRAWCGLA